MIKVPLTAILVAHMDTVIASMVKPLGYHPKSHAHPPTVIHKPLMAPPRLVVGRIAPPRAYIKAFAPRRMGQ